MQWLKKYSNNDLCKRADKFVTSMNYDHMTSDGISVILQPSGKTLLRFGNTDRQRKV